MFCRGCGKELLKGSRFCVNCGQEADFFVDENATKDNNTSEVGNVVETGIPERAPKQMRRMVGVQSYAPKPLSKGMIIGIVAGGVATVVITIVVIAVVIAGRHDLEGTYSYGGRFPITTITFSKDGTFTARCDYSEYSTGAIYYGEYYKDGDTYEIRFTDAKSNTNNTVVDFSNRSYGLSFELSASKNPDGSLLFWVSGGTSYWAWMFYEATFYKTR